ncbi:MAG: NMD3-related protein [Promethearchaeota archaeon]
MNRFCPKCANPIDLETLKTYGMCKECYVKQGNLFNLGIETTRIQICPTCLKFRNLGENEKTWHVPDKQTYRDTWIQAIYYYFISKIENNDDFDFFIDFEDIPDVIDAGKHNLVKFTLTGHSRESNGKNEKEERVNLILDYSVASCNDCALKRAGYYNSMIQLRGGKKRDENEGLFLEIIDLIKKYEDANLVHGINGINSIDKTKSGYNIKLISKKHGKILVHEIKHRYCVVSKESFKVIGPDHMTGGNLKRSFFSIRLYPFYPGDIFTIEKSHGPELLIKVKSESVELFSLKTGKTRHVKPEVLHGEDQVFQANYDEFLEFQLVSVTDDALILMSLGDYSEIQVKKQPWLDFNENEGIVQGTWINDVLYVMPREYTRGYQRGVEGT